MPQNSTHRGWRRLGAGLALTLAACLALLAYFSIPLRRTFRESLMQHVTSAHYEVLWPPGAMPTDAARQFAMERESLFVDLDRKLNDAASNREIRVIFDPEFTSSQAAAGAARSYEVTGHTIRTKLDAPIPQLDATADAEALLRMAWGKPGNALIGQWTAHWLVGQWQGDPLGMAAAMADGRLGHKKVASLLGQPSDAALSPADRELLGAAWINAIAELAGPANVRKLYSERMTAPGMSEVTKALGTTSTELERAWQMWMYAYIAGMPAASHDMAMPMNMPMSNSH